MLAMMDKYSFSSEVEIRVTTCLGTQTTTTIILKRVCITCRLERKTLFIHSKLLKIILRLPMRQNTLDTGGGRYTI